MMDLVTDNFSLPTPQSRRVRPTERLCLEDHVSPTGFRLQAGFQATTVTLVSIGAWALHGSALVNMGVWELYGGAIVGATQV